VIKREKVRKAVDRETKGEEEKGEIASAEEERREKGRELEWLMRFGLVKLGGTTKARAPATTSKEGLLVLQAAEETLRRNLWRYRYIGRTKEPTFPPPILFKAHDSPPSPSSTSPIPSAAPSTSDSSPPKGSPFPAAAALTAWIAINATAFACASAAIVDASRSLKKFCGYNEAEISKPSKRDQSRKK